MRRLYIIRWLRVQWGRVFRRIVQRGASAHSIALGTAIGVFLAFTPTVGLQMVLGVFIATLVRANRVAAAVPAWITNPATIVPIYSFNYWVGLSLTGSGPGLKDFEQELTRILELIQTAGGLAGGRALLELGLEILLPLWVGCVLVGAFCALPVYPLMVRAVNLFRLELSRKRARRHQQFMERLRIREVEHLGEDRPN